MRALAITVITLTVSVTAAAMVSTLIFRDSGAMSQLAGGKAALCRAVTLAAVAIRANKEDGLTSMELATPLP